MKNSGTTVWIDTMPEVLHQRLMKEKDKRPLIKDLTDEQLRGFILKKYSDRRIYYEQADIIVAEDPVELDKLIQRIFHA